MARKLTEHQARVLAAVERRGGATVLDLRHDFVDRYASELGRTLMRLTDLGHLRVEGDPFMLLVGGVTFFPASTPPESRAVLTDLHTFVTRSLHLTAWWSGAVLHVGIPLAEFERDLTGASYSAFQFLMGSPAGSLDLFRAHLREMVAAGEPLSVRVSTRVSGGGGEHCLVVQVAHSEISEPAPKEMAN